jgi:uncharacterized protein
VIAFLDRKDQYHQWAVNLAKRFKPPFYTCEPVIAESSYHLFKAAGVQGVQNLMRLIDDDILKIDFSVSENATRIKTLCEKYPNMGFFDACVVAMTEQPKFADCLVLTVAFSIPHWYD